MATNQQTFALIAVVVVLASFGLGSYNTGSATVNAMDFSVKSISMPTASSGWPIEGTAVFSNSGTVSASFVPYRYEVLNEGGSVVFGTTEKASLIAGKDNAATLPKIPWLATGRYTARITLDYAQRFAETDEGNNVFTSGFVVL